MNYGTYTEHVRDIYGTASNSNAISIGFFSGFSRRITGFYREIIIPALPAAINDDLRVR
jgi:hypothetical protein